MRPLPAAAAPPPAGSRQQLAPLNDQSLKIVLDGISRADDLREVLAEDLLNQGPELNLNTASYNKAVANLIRVNLRSYCACANVLPLDSWKRS